MDEESGRESITQGVSAIDAIVNNMSRSLRFTSCIMGAKAQSGMSQEMIARFNNTARHALASSLLRLFPVSKYLRREVRWVSCLLCFEANTKSTVERPASVVRPTCVQGARPTCHRKPNPKPKTDFGNMESADSSFVVCSPDVPLLCHTTCYTSSRSVTGRAIVIAAACRFASSHRAAVPSPSLLSSPQAQNPVLLNTVGLWLLYFEIPSLPQLPPSSTLLRQLWPRLQDYSITSKPGLPWSSGGSGWGVGCGESLMSADKREHRIGRQK